MTPQQAAQHAVNVARVQDYLERHMESDFSGCCVACGEVAPCDRRLATYRVFSALGELPSRRQPGRWAHRSASLAIGSPCD
jgi:hypothetical protein